MRRESLRSSQSPLKTLNNLKSVGSRQSSADFLRFLPMRGCISKFGSAALSDANMAKSGKYWLTKQFAYRGGKKLCFSCHLCRSCYFSTLRKTSSCMKIGGIGKILNVRRPRLDLLAALLRSCISSTRESHPHPASLPSPTLSFMKIYGFLYIS